MTKKDKAIQIITMFFGNTAKQRFRRGIIFIVLILSLVGLILFMLFNFSYDPQQGPTVKPGIKAEFKTGS